MYASEGLLEALVDFEFNLNEVNSLIFTCNY